MGAADVIPGVSGGTIAFITGIYDELLKSIKSFDYQAFKLLLSFRFAELARKVNLWFLLTLILGIFTSLLLFSSLILYLLQSYKELVWSFFFGLVLASTVLVFRQIKHKSPLIWIAALLGGLLAYAITSMGQTETPNELWFVFLCGSIAICAMILPGISGSFILVLLSKYEYIFGALKDFKMSVILTFGLGCVTGIIGFSHILTWLLRKYHDITVALLAGFMLGSLNKVWPWKKVLQTYVDRHGQTKPLLELNVSPFDYQGDSYFWGCIGLCLFGILLVYVIEIMASKMKGEA